MSQDIRDQLVVLYQKMAELTLPECRSTCRVPLSCCSPEYCELAQEYAREEWGVDLTSQRTNHPKLPFMGPNGCVVPPHLRPICTIHTCQVNNIGEKLHDPEWNTKYFKLREELMSLEMERSGYAS